jgi:GNAT superfamily N-acetyltransferase
MKLIEVIDKKTEKEFHQVCEIIYRADVNYIPHIRQDLDKIFDRSKNKLFKQGGELIRWILKDTSDNLIGRVAAFIHPKTSQSGKYKIGSMGFFECINNQEAAFVLFDACKKWLQERKMEGMEGPVNFGERDQFWGLLVQNFDAQPSYGMNYNPPYYQSFFDAYGFQNYFNQYVYWRNLDLPVQDVFIKKSNIIGQNPDFRVSNMQGVPLAKIAEYFLEVYNSAWGGHEGFKNMRLEQAKAIINSMKLIMDRDLLIFAFIKDVPVGFYLNIPELNEFFLHVNGNLNWIGKLKFFYHLKFAKRKTMLGIVFGVAREHQGKGIEGAMIKFAEDYIVSKKRYTETIITWVGDFNPKMLRVIENLGTELYRTLVTYRIFFDSSIKFERHPVLGEKLLRDESTENEMNVKNN